MTSGIALLKEILDSCSDAERKAADHILAQPRTAVFCTVAELARRAETSAPAVVRLCKRAGLSGYRELQLLLARDLYAPAGAEEPAPAFELDSSRTIEDIAANVVDRTKEALDRVFSLVRARAVEEAVAILGSARSVAAFGVGASGIVAYDLYQKLVRIGIPCSFAFDPHVQIAAACGLGPQDAAIAVSYSGTTPAIVRAAEEARACGAKVVAIATPGPSPISRLADVHLAIPATESVFRQGASLSRSTQLVMVDILYGALVSRNIERVMPLLERSMKATHDRERNP
jgi:DNA-binding MurR/RpiR family transcriptional regulator